MLDETRLQEIEKRHKAARKGPYRMWTGNSIIDPHGQVVAASVIVPEDRAMLANSWKDIGDLLDEVAALRKKYRVGLEEAAEKIAAMPKKVKS